MAKTISTNLIGRKVKQSPRAPFAWFVREDKSEAGYASLAAEGRIVATWTEIETAGDHKGESLLKVGVEALDGEAKYASHFLLVETTG